MQSHVREQHFGREVEMYEAVLRLFEKFETSFAEVPFFGKRIDLVFGSRTLLSLCAVETKLRDWRNAFKQAALNQVAAQRSYVAVPEPLATRLFRNEQELFLEYNVGLIGVNDRANIIVPSTRNACFSLAHYRILKDTIAKASSKKPKRIGVVADAISKRTKALVVLQTRAD